MIKRNISPKSDILWHALAPSLTHPPYSHLVMDKSYSLTNSENDGSRLQQTLHQPTNIKFTLTRQALTTIQPPCQTPTFAPILFSLRFSTSSGLRCWERNCSRNPITNLMSLGLVKRSTTARHTCKHSVSDTSLSLSKSWKAATVSEGSSVSRCNTCRFSISCKWEKKNQALYWTSINYHILDQRWKVPPFGRWSLLKKMENIFSLLPCSNYLILIPRVLTTDLHFNYEVNILKIPFFFFHFKKKSEINTHAHTKSNNGQESVNNSTIFNTK